MQNVSSKVGSPLNQSFGVNLVIDNNGDLGEPDLITTSTEAADARYAEIIAENNGKLKDSYDCDVARQFYMQCEIPQELTFGQYVQKILSELVLKQRWDDPYAAICPTFDPEGQRLDFLFQSYLAGVPVAEAVRRNLDS